MVKNSQTENSTMKWLCTIEFKMNPALIFTVPEIASYGTCQLPSSFKIKYVYTTPDPLDPLRHPETSWHLPWPTTCLWVCPLNQPPTLGGLVWWGYELLEVYTCPQSDIYGERSRPGTRTSSLVPSLQVKDVLLGGLEEERVVSQQACLPCALCCCRLGGPAHWRRASGWRRGLGWW